MATGPHSSAKGSTISLSSDCLEMAKGGRFWNLSNKKRELTELTTKKTEIWGSEVMSQTIQNESLYTLKPGVTPYIEPRPTSAVLRLSYCSISKHRPPKSVNETTPFGSTNRLQNGFNLSDFWQQGDRSTPFCGEFLTLKWASNVSRIICKHETWLYIYITPSPVVWNTVWNTSPEIMVLYWIYSFWALGTLLQGIKSNVGGMGLHT